MNYTIKQLPKEERPREKMKELGLASLTDVELLAILLKSGTKNESVKVLATKVMLRYHTLRALQKTSLEELMKIKGIKEAKAMSILCAIELGNRLQKEPIKEKKKIETPKDLYDYFHLDLEKETQEHFIAVFLNTKNEILSFKTIFIGSANKSIVHPRDIFKEAIRSSAVKMMVLHNHPSGDPTPSKEDINFTKRLMKAGELMQIPLLDHVIIGMNQYYSFYDNFDENG